jgi:glycosyltransferase involved in cell wall biosynthesis
MLTPDEMTAEIRSSKVVVFPFRLIPSEMPVGPLEAIGCGANVIVPQLSSLIDLERYGAYTYKPNDTHSLTTAIENALAEQSKPDRAANNRVKRWSLVCQGFEEELYERSGST